MPFFLWPVVAAVLGCAGGRNWDAPTSSESTDSEPPTKDSSQNESSRPLPLNEDYSDRLSPNSREKSVQFSDRRMRDSEIVRSLHVHSERLSQNQHRHMEALWRSASSFQSQNSAAQFDAFTGFVGGDFASGKVKDIKLSTGCWVMKFSQEADLLAVGLKNQVDFLETTRYTTIYSLPFTDKVSAIQWCPASALSPKSMIDDKDHNSLPTSSTLSSGQLIAVAGLNGHVAVYRFTAELLEIQGAELLFELQINRQVRCLTLHSFNKGRVLLTVGDKDGKITLATLTGHDDGSITGTTSLECDLDGDSVLGLDVCIPLSLMAASTKSGKVVVYRLSSHSDEEGRIKAVCHSQLWTQQRNGAVRAVVFVRNGQHIAFGGYDKTLAFVDTTLFAVVREVTLKGTINTIAMDPLDRFLVVGCRDKSLTFFDTTSFFPVKRFLTPGWVTSISWGNPGHWADIVAVRSENKRISLLDMTPIGSTDIALSSGEGPGNSISWSADGFFLARIHGDSIRVVDSRLAFCPSASIEIQDSRLSCIAFRPRSANREDDMDSVDKDYILAAVGLDGNLYILRFTPASGLEIVDTLFVQKNLWVVSWSKVGDLLAVGGKGVLGRVGKTLNIYAMADELTLRHPSTVDGRIWDIGFSKATSDEDGESIQTPSMTVASGDYTAVMFETDTFHPMLQVVRQQTARCLDYHPRFPLLALGDGAGLVAIVDYQKEQTVTEFETGGRVNVLSFSPAGDYLIVGTDKGDFTLHETKGFKIVQEFPRGGFALSASFSPNGKYLALGSSNEPYALVRLGPLLGIDLVPLDTGTSNLPSWALKETLFRSGFGPSLIQRHMMHGSQDSLQWVASTLREYPDTIYTRNRLRQEGCFDTALRLRKMKLLQLAVTALVDGSLEANNEGRRSILTTDLPEIGRTTLEAMVARHPPELIVDIMKRMTFVKVPFTHAHVVSRDRQKFCASSRYLDPWTKYRFVDMEEEREGTLTKTAAVLPIPGLGTLSFLSGLVSKAPATVFDNEAMALVLRVMWQSHIRKYFIFDTCVFLSYYILWILLMESISLKSTGMDTMASIPQEKGMAIAILVLNSLFAVKETIQSDYGRHSRYFSSFWNQVDMGSIVLVYIFCVLAVVRGEDGSWLIPMAVVTTLLLTLKLISYLRAFHETGWLVTVLSQNFEDVKGFLVVLFSILVGFSTSFRLLFANNNPSCGIEIDSETNGFVQTCDDNPFGTLRQSILSTFELTILATYEPSMVYESQHSALAVLVFVGAVTCVLVVVLNALISLLADSYARVQENAAANRRKEKAQLIVEYMSLLTPWRRRRIERDTKYFHALLEADADGDLVLDADDWHGGLNALREDLEATTKSNAEAQQEAIDRLRDDIEKEMSSFRETTLSLLQELSVDIKKIKEDQAKNLGNMTGKKVAGAVKAVRNIQRQGSEFWQPKGQTSINSPT